MSTVRRNLTGRWPCLGLLRSTMQLAQLLAGNRQDSLEVFGHFSLLKTFSVVNFFRDTSRFLIGVKRRTTDQQFLYLDGTFLQHSDWRSGYPVYGQAHVFVSMRRESPAISLLSWRQEHDLNFFFGLCQLPFSTFSLAFVKNDVPVLHSINTCTY